MCPLFYALLPFRGKNPSFPLWSRQSAERRRILAFRFFPNSQLTTAHPVLSFPCGSDLPVRVLMADAIRRVL
jgi:hypothetical protein